MALQKTFLAKVYDQDGETPLTTFTFSQEGEGTLKALPSFTSTINGGLGEMLLDLKLPFDDFGEGTNVAFMNIVDLWVVDRDHPRGRRVYRGYVSKFAPYFEGGDEGVRVTCLGLVSLYTTSFYKDGASFTVSHASDDPTNIAKDINDHFNTAYDGSLITYDASSIPATVGTTVSVEFVDQRWSDAIRKAIELAGEGWWWHVDENGKLNFKAKPVSATHTFTIGKDIESIEGTKDSEKVVNDVVVRGPEGATTSAVDLTSQSTYGTGSPAIGLRSQIITDSSLADINARTQRAAKEIADNKDAKVQSPFTVNTNYDLESIKVGDTCKIANIKKGNTFFNDNMLIVALTYDGDTVRIEVEQLGVNFGRELATMINDVNVSTGVSGGSSGGGGGGDTFVDRETPSGTVNGSNTAFTLAGTPTAGSEHFFINGVLQNQGSGNDYVISGTGITTTVAPPLGAVLLVSYRTATVTDFADREVPTGIINGSNTAFTLAHTPTSGSLHVYLNGILQNEGASNDYTLSGTTITFNTAPPSGSVLLASYRY